MVNVERIKVTINGDNNFVLLKSECDENVDDENLFHYSDSWSFGNAQELCDLIADEEVAEILTPSGSYLEIDVAKIGTEKTGYRHAVIACVNYENSLHCVFGFSSENDANTAHKMAQRYYELAHADEDAVAKRKKFFG